MSGRFKHVFYQAEPLKQQKNQPTMEIGATVAANDNSDQTVKKTILTVNNVDQAKYIYA
jgi:hypothetical protein